MAEARNGPGAVTLPFSLVGTRTSHTWAGLPGNFDRLNCRALFPSTNQWGIPDLPAADWQPTQLVAYSDGKALANAKPGAAIHFFLDDYRFEAVWNRPEQSLNRIRPVGAALTPDFSLWRDMPHVMQLWQTYRARWCGAWMAHHSIRVIPTVGWSTPSSWPFCFAGIPQGSVVALSTVGIRDGMSDELYAAGYAEMVRQLQPSLVLCYGKLLRPSLVLHYGPEPAGQTYDAVQVRLYPTRWETNGR